MPTSRPRLALFALAPLALAACSAKQQPFVTAPSAEPLGTSAQPADESPVEREASVREGRSEPRGDDAPPPFGGAPSADEARRDADGPSSETPVPAARSHGDLGNVPDGATPKSSAGAGEEAWKKGESQADARGRAYRPQPEFRPGLATQWGEARYSAVSSAPFFRADDVQPFAIGKLFYNDQAGVDAMTGGRASASRSMFSVGSGYLEVGLRDANGRFISGFTANGDNFVPGYAGQRYSIVVRNVSPGRLEVLASVDGLDVVDGRPASFTKRGYLLEPWGQVEIEGFRTSTSEVASFRFGSVAQSYAAQKHGDTRNVGVIGIAAFYERGDGPWRWSAPPPPPRYPDAERRLDADPFPMRFASPPR